MSLLCVIRKKTAAAFSNNAKLPEKRGRGDLEEKERTFELLLGGEGNVVEHLLTFCPGLRNNSYVAFDLILLTLLEIKSGESRRSRNA